MDVQIIRQNDLKNRNNYQIRFDIHKRTCKNSEYELFVFLVKLFFQLYDHFTKNHNKISKSKSFVFISLFLHYLHYNLFDVFRTIIKAPNVPQSMT